MKQLILYISAIALLTACGNKTQQNGNAAPADSDSTVTKTVEAPQIPALKTDSIGKEKTDEKAEVSVIVDWPTEGDQALVTAVRNFICKELKVKMSDDGNTVVKKAFNNIYNETAELWEETYSDNDDDNDDDGDDENNDAEEEDTKGPCFSNSIALRKIADTDKYVTYSIDGFTYSGGAHGMSGSSGVTFSKATAKMIGYQKDYNEKNNTFTVLNQTLFNGKVKSKAFNDVLKAGLKEYFAGVTDDGKKALTDAELKEMLMDEDVNKLPLPGAPPHFTKDGLAFIYQQYEIAAYCYGMPSFTIPYEKILPFLTTEAAELAK